jgi:hypothetical protein
MRLFLPGGAGLVGLNMIQQLRERRPDWDLLGRLWKIQAIHATMAL